MDTSQKLALAVNHAISDYKIASARYMAANPGMQGAIDQKRCNAWNEYGFPEKVEFSMLYSLYSRGGIAFGAIERLINNCWSKFPEIIEGEEKEENAPVTKWERTLKKVLSFEFWNAFVEADRRRLVGRYSALILRIADNSKLSEPVTPSSALRIDEFVPAWSESLKPCKWDTDKKSPTYGKVVSWNYTQVDEFGRPSTIDEIHASRIFIIGSYSNKAIAFLEPAFNSFVSMEKVEGGSGESFLKNASRQVSVSFDKEVDLENLAKMYGVSMSELREKFDEAAKELNRGNDAMLITQGASVAPITTAIADPESTYNTLLQTISAAVDIPSKILVGMQTGERASTEDQKYFNSRCQFRRERELTFEIKRFIEKLQGLKILEPVSNFSVIWEDLRESTQGEKLDIAEKMAKINQLLIAAGDAIAFDASEIRIAAGYAATSQSFSEGA